MLPPRKEVLLRSIDELQRSKIPEAEREIRKLTSEVTQMKSRVARMKEAIVRIAESEVAEAAERHKLDSLVKLPSDFKLFRTRGGEYYGVQVVKDGVPGWWWQGTHHQKPEGVLRDVSLWLEDPAGYPAVEEAACLHCEHPREHHYPMAGCEVNENCSCPGYDKHPVSKYVLAKTPWKSSFDDFGTGDDDD